MRDSLSLTDQAIAQGQGHISLANTQQMLGGIDQNWVYKILIALLKQDGQILMDLSQEIASYAPSYNRLFAELIQLFHQIALVQIVEQHFDLSVEQASLLKQFSQVMSAEDIQLYYQISLDGRKDLPYAADEQAAFDMTLLRLFAFKPMAKSQTQRDDSATIVPQEISFTETLPSINVGEVTSNTNTNVNEEPLPEYEALERAQVDLAGEMAMIEQQAVAMENSLNEQTIENLAETDTNTDANTNVSQEINESKLEPQLSSVNSLAEQHKQTPEPNSSQQQPVQPVPNATQISQEIPKETPQESSQDTSSLAIDSPVAAVLATRNMLRSRKKQLENQEKKPSDAIARQASQNSADSVDQTAVDNVSAKIDDKSNLLEAEPETPYQQDNIDPATVRKANQVDKWAHMIDSMQLSARIRQLAIHATISEESTDEHLILLLDQATRHLNTEVAQEQLKSIICEFLGRNVTVSLNIVDKTVADPYQIQGHINDKRYDYAKELIKADPTVVALQENFQATLDEESITAR
jgi:DNA polymerase-3 subunit gamma/tau